MKILLHPFAIAIYCLIFGSFGIFNNENFSDGSTPVWFHGQLSIYLGIAFYIAGFLYLAYSVYKTIKNKQS